MDGMLSILYECTALTSWTTSLFKLVLVTLLDWNIFDKIWLSQMHAIKIFSIMNVKDKKFLENLISKYSKKELSKNILFIDMLWIAI